MENLKFWKELSFKELIEHGRNNGANIVNGMPWSWKINGKAVTHERDDLYLVECVSGIERVEEGDHIRAESDGLTFQPYYDKYGKSEQTTNVIGAVHESMYKPSTHRLLDAKPPIEPILKSLATPNPLDDSELRKKANESYDKHHCGHMVTIGHSLYNTMLDFAKYYHSIQAKELQEKYDDLVKRTDCYLEEKDKELGQLREEVMSHLEGKFIVLYDSTMPKFDSFEEAVQRAKSKNDKHLQIFKLVAEVEKVTTINVKEV